MRQTAPISEVIEESAAFVVRGSNVHCVVDLPQDLWVVEIDSGQMRQVINNLLINAGEAMPDGGTVRISGCNLERAPGPLSEGRYIEVAIRDEGHGISAEHVDRIFDP